VPLLSATGSNEHEKSAVHVPASGGTVKWVSGDEYTIKLTGEQSNGSLGFVVATVPPGNGPVAHIHTEHDESFFVLSGELEFLGGEKTFTASTGDFVFVPRGIRHRFKNLTSTDVKMAFFTTPGGQEEFFLRYGDEPLPGHSPELWTMDRFTPEMLEFSDKVLKNVLAPE
jgi:quercetin dioxygenase-like cupin family protein